MDAILAEVERREAIKPIDPGKAKSWQLLDPGSLEDLIWQALDAIDPDCHREDWFKVLCALKSVEQFDCHDIAEEWSVRGSKYDALGFERTWDSIEPRDDGYKVGTLFWLAGFQIEQVAKGQLGTDQEFPFLVVDRLYSDTRWICVSGKLHRREVTNYEARTDEAELQRIQILAESVSYYCGKRKREVFPFAKPSAIKNALEWVKIKFAIDPALCNPDGVNCLNGILTFDENDQPVLTPHNPDQYFLYKPTAYYDPDAPTEDCDRLLAAMRPAQVEVFLKTIAAIFNIKKTRLKVGRLRALLAIGTGSNGKDALRHAISTLLGGTGMSDVTLEDFAEHDGGRKFNTARLRGSVVNWASENRAGVNLDKLKTLMRAITGETLTYELKGRDSEDYKPKAVNVFNLNELPNRLHRK